jgi:hypothetical protein
VSGTQVATVKADVTSDRKQAHSGLSVTTLMIASLSSLAAALVVSKLWGGGTLIGAAMTPVIVALVSEGLRRPATVITTVRTTRGGYDPVAEGRAGLREGDLERARAPVPAAAAAERRVHRAGGRAMSGGGFRFRLPRPRVIAAVVTGLVAFVVAGVVLTGSELVLGKSVVSSSKRTTYIPVKRSTSTTDSKTTSTQDTTTTTTPTTSTATTTAPSTTTTTAPTTQTAPAPATTAPTTSAAPDVPTTPAPQSATPPASTTP